jgi:hypothetical protein
MDFLAKIDTEKNTFIPLGADAFKKSLRLKEGDHIKIETWKERNVLFHRKYFAFLNTVIFFLPEEELYDKLRNIDYLRYEIMLLIGEVDVHVSMEGTQNLTPRSISFKSMDNNRFEDVYTKSIDAALKYFLKDISKEDFEKHIINFL